MQSIPLTLAQQPNPFYQGPEPLFRVLVVGVLAYLALIFLLRISGSRTLSKMNAFDFIVTIALGSTLATVLLNKQVSLSEGVLAFAVLIFLQYAVTWSSVRWPIIQRTVTGAPNLVFHRGRFLRDAMRRARVTEDEVLAAARNQGHADRSTILAIILETDGAFSVIPTPDSGPPTPPAPETSTLTPVPDPTTPTA
jgi:uncharacterized membrane protein YcaP (DUF421 family)